MTLTAIIVAFAVVAAACDVRSGIIPRQLTLFGLLCGLLIHAIVGGFLCTHRRSDPVSPLASHSFNVGAIGGGDVKPITALGALLGLKSW